MMQQETKDLNTVLLAYDGPPARRAQVDREEILQREFRGINGEIGLTAFQRRHAATEV
jgi:hypothetical protein